MAVSDPDLKQLENKLSICFQDPSLLRTALTHASTQTSKQNKENDNERLEFLGDRVLGLSICSQVMALFPKAREGELARRYNQLVKRQMCAKIAREIDLGRFLILSAGEARSGGREKTTILANAMEALLGAVFLDQGYEASHELIAKLWQPYLQADEDGLLDAKTALQEWAQGQGYDLPIYEAVDRSGPDHKPVFVTKVSVKGVGQGQGQGASKRIAEQLAAKDLLEQQKIWDKTNK